jgi:hypothetical protein
MKKQTAVKWLAHAIIDVMDKSFFRTLSMDKQREIKGIYEQAKAMEKEQMLDFADNCQEMFLHQIVEKYNETYGGEE